MNVDGAGLVCKYEVGDEDVPVGGAILQGQ